MPQLCSVRNPTSGVYPSLGSPGHWSARMRWAGAVLVALLGLLVTPSWALIDAEIHRQSLRGLPGVMVIIAGRIPEMEQTGLTQQQLQTDVELRLRLAGIRVLTEQERLEVLGQPWLLITINVILNHRPSLTPYSISVELIQSVTLATGEMAPGAATWELGTLGTFGFNNHFRIREQVRDLVDEFINAYLSVNPRPQVAHHRPRLPHHPRPNRHGGRASARGHAAPSLPLGCCGRRHLKGDDDGHTHPPLPHGDGRHAP